MSGSNDFLSHFDDEGRYKDGDGEISVVFLTNGGGSYSGNLRFKNGLLVSAEMDGASAWVYPDQSPLNGLKFLLHFEAETPRAVFVDEGRVVHFGVPDRATKQEFLSNFQLSRNLFVHSRVEGDSPTIDTNTVTEASTRGALWLTHKSVEGFNAADFCELGAAGWRD